MVVIKRYLAGIILTFLNNWLSWHLLSKSDFLYSLSLWTSDLAALGVYVY